MANPIYAVVNPQGVVVNMTVWDGVRPYDVTPNTLVPATGQTNAQIGATYAAGVFTPPAQPAAPQGIVFANSPASGTTLPMPAVPQPQGKLYAYLQPAAALASLAIVMPPNPMDGDVLNLLSSKAITALSFVPTFQGAPSTLAAGANGAAQFTYSQQLGNWFQW